MFVPEIKVFVRHTAECKYSGDENYQNCKCRKHLRWTNADGVQVRRSAKTRAWSQAVKRRRELERGFEDGKPVTNIIESRMTLAEVGELFLQSKRNSGKGQTSMAKRTAGINRLVEFMDGCNVTFATQITDKNLEDYRETWLTVYPSSVTRQQVQRRLMEFFRFCVAKRHMDHVPLLEKIEIAEGDGEQTQPLTPDEYERLITAAPTALYGIGKVVKANPELGRKVAALAACMRWSGLSIRDASCLKRASIIEEDGAYRIKTRRIKTGIEVNVKIPPHIAQELLSVPNDNAEFIFWNRKNGSGVTAAHHHAAWLTQAAAAAGIADFGTHRLRDTFAVRLLEKKAPIELVSKLLGHKSVRTTEMYYNSWNPTRQAGLDAEVEKGW
jgi:integrase/recombinase XerD